MKQPREYQDAAHWSTWNYIHDPNNYTGGVATDGKGPKYPLIVEATGLGKSLNIAMLMWHLSTTYPGVNIMQLCHVKELVASNYEELVGMWPTAPVGVYAASMNRRDTDYPLTFAMINSVANRAASFGKVDFVIIDECHRLSDNDKTMYGKFLDALRSKNPNLIVIGYTATDYRMKGGKLTDMGLFDDVVYDIGSGESFLWAVEQGYLILPVPTDPGFKVDDSEIGISGGDYKNSEASQAMRDQGIIEQAVDFSIEIAKKEGHRSAIAFAQSVEDADLIADMLSCKGYPTEAVHSRMDGDRDAILEAHKRGELWGVANKDILTTGWNNPLVTLMMNLRLTRSPGLWVQMVGRMTRPIWVRNDDGSMKYDIMTLEGRWASIHESGKLTSRVLDFCGNTERLGPINYPFIPGKRKKGAGGEAPVRTCSPAHNTYDHYEEEHNSPACSPATIHHTSVKVCPHCGYKWPKSNPVKVQASTSKLVTANNPLGLPPIKKKPKEYEVFSVHEMICTFNEGREYRDQDTGRMEKKLDTMKVTYRCGLDRFNEWVGMEHSEKSFYGKKSRKWWDIHSGDKPYPETIAEAVDRAHELKMPKFIRVWTNTKYPEVVGHDFIGTKFELPKEIGKIPDVHDPEPDPLEREREAAAKAMEYGGYGGGYYDDEIPF